MSVGIFLAIMFGQIGGSADAGGPDADRPAEFRRALEKVANYALPQMSGSARRDEIFSEGLPTQHTMTTEWSFVIGDKARRVDVESFRNGERIQRRIFCINPARFVRVDIDLATGEPIVPQLAKGSEDNEQLQDYDRWFRSSIGCYLFPSDRAARENILEAMDREHYTIVDSREEQSDSRNLLRLHFECWKVPTIINDVEFLVDPAQDWRLYAYQMRWRQTTTGKQGVGPEGSIEYLSTTPLPIASRIAARINPRESETFELTQLSFGPQDSDHFTDQQLGLPDLTSPPPSGSKPYLWLAGLGVLFLLAAVSALMVRNRRLSR